MTIAWASPADPPQTPAWTTGGDWRAVPTEDGDVAIRDAEDATIGVFAPALLSLLGREITPEQALANARVAAAAPALFRALRRLVRERRCDRVLHGGDRPCAEAGVKPCRTCQAQAALALAREP